MLFNSYEFIFFFLPLTLIVFFFLGKRKTTSAALIWLVLTSLVFYSWWKPAYLILIVTSMLFNYQVGLFLGRYRQQNKSWAKSIAVGGVAANLFLLGYYKYANFFVDNINFLSGSDYHLQKILLPLGISFFTFQQITYVVDAYRGETQEYNFIQYCLFVTFFPQLIAGPIVHHKEMLPQFAKPKVFRFNLDHFALGVSIFCLGLFKKVVLADTIAPFASSAFALADKGQLLTIYEAWAGALAYTFQIYFDFSGYSDMAIGLGWMFGIVLPVNFHSPYQANNIIEFWRRWHITLSRLLKEYLYVGLGGNRKGQVRRYLNLMITMILGGLWHGAGWTFVIWGSLHGVYLVINHLWRKVIHVLGLTPSFFWGGKILSRLLTFLAVVLAWVFFRATTLSGACNMLKTMLGLNGIALPQRLLGHLGTLEGWLIQHGFVFAKQLPNGIVSFPETFAKYILCLFFIIWFVPNTQEIMVLYKPVIRTYWGRPSGYRLPIRFYFSLPWAIFMSVIAIYSIVNISTAGEFLYFNF